MSKHIIDGIPAVGLLMTYYQVMKSLLPKATLRAHDLSNQFEIPCKKHCKEQYYYIDISIHA